MEVLIILDSVRYDQFLSAEVPKMKSVGRAVRAVAHARWTRPSVVSILSGYLPTSSYGQIWSPSWVMMRDRRTDFFNSNAWLHGIAPSRMVEHWYPEALSLPRMVGDAVEALGEAERLILFVAETHNPYSLNPTEELRRGIERFNDGEDLPEMVERCREEQLKTLRWVDSHLGVLMDSLPEGSRCIITSDHGELMGEHHLIGHDPTFPFHPVLLEVPLIVGVV